MRLRSALLDIGVERAAGRVGRPEGSGPPGLPASGLPGLGAFRPQGFPTSRLCLRSRKLVVGDSQPWQLGGQLCCDFGALALGLSSSGAVIRGRRSPHRVRRAIQSKARRVRRDEQDRHRGAGCGAAGGRGAAAAARGGGRVPARAEGAGAGVPEGGGAHAAARAGSRCKMMAGQADRMNRAGRSIFTRRNVPRLPECIGRCKCTIALGSRPIPPWTEDDSH